MAEQARTRAGDKPFPGKKEMAMDGKEAQKEMFRLVKSNMETYFQTQEMLQDQSEKMLDTLITQSAAIQTEGKNLLKKWLESLKKANADYQRVMEENLKKGEEFLDKAG